MSVHFTIHFSFTIKIWTSFGMYFKLCVNCKKNWFTGLYFPSENVHSKRMSNGYDNKHLYHEYFFLWIYCQNTILDWCLSCLRQLNNYLPLWYLRFAKYFCWIFMSSGTWHCVIGWMVHEILKVCGAFTFKGWVTTNPATESHISDLNC